MSNVIALPTRPVIDSKWQTYARMKQRLAYEPGLDLDPEFMAAFERAETEWNECWSAWEQRA